MAHLITCYEAEKIAVEYMVTRRETRVCEICRIECDADDPCCDGQSTSTAIEREEII